MSPFGTFETCRPILPMSVHGGRPEVCPAHRQGNAIDPERPFPTRALNDNLE